MINARDGHLGSAEPRVRLAGTASPYHAGVSARRLFFTLGLHALRVDERSEVSV